MNVIRAAIRLLVMVVLMGSLILWIMMPTNTYRQKWWLHIRANTNSTYFGVQGATMLLYTFPILFVATLGSVYLHLGKKLSHAGLERNGKKNRLALWKRPAIVGGPLGILSGVELGFFIMFIALLVWSFSTFLRVGFARITPQLLAERGEQLWEAKLDSAALRLGLVGNICLAFLFFPVTRGSSVLPLFGLNSEGSIKYHIWVGHIAMVLFTAHGLCYIIYWAATDRMSEMLKWSKIHVANVPGEISLVAGLVMWATTIPGVRRKMFELFLYTHYFYVLFVFFFILHVGINYSCMMLPGFYLFMVDRYLRFLQSRQRVRLLSARILPCETLELNFSKSPGLSYTSTSIMFVNVPSISKLQWHPFTISSSSNLEPEQLSLVIKSEGSWSKKLYEMLSSPSLMERLDVSLEGPYGPASTHFLRHDTLVMVSGGSGITPFISIIRELIFMSKTLKCKTPQLLLICAFKNSSQLTMLDLLHPLSGTSSGFSNLQLQIEAYVTREKEPTTQNSKLLQTICLIYSYSLKALLNMLIICICIAMTASAAVLWNKKQNAKEANQYQNINGLSPIALSPASGSHNADRELESLPHQSLVQSTKVHYGKRPDLKRMIFERKGSSVGVLVCGPKTMRHEVATICSSGLADNLHFEAMSFSW
ncbi:hypothetical protein L1049_013682 [Liquidambar formosana]|uniref:ferric-chelate reductase (NADH) n=1 Tax=Liquidambar formosana TaxID=63359 RepID=A0AAP0WYI4_LIQFO